MPIIRCEMAVRAPADRCFDLARSVDLHVDSSREIGARAQAGRCTGLSCDGETTVWSARFLGLRFAMRTRIHDFARPDHFSDSLDHGPLRRFAHVYRFAPLADGGCRMSDELRVEAHPALGGRLLERVYLVRRMEYLVRRRLEQVKAVAEGDGWHRYLGDAPSPPGGPQVPQSHEGEKKQTGANR